MSVAFAGADATAIETAKPVKSVRKDTVTVGLHIVQGVAPLFAARRAINLKPITTGGLPPAEAVEGRASPKGNSRQYRDCVPSTAHSDMTMLFPGGGKAHCLENPAEQPEETA